VSTPPGATSSKDPRSIRYAEFLLVGVLIALAVLARWEGWRVKTGDMEIFFQWYHQLKAAGGWRGIDQEIGNYNAPFSYIMALITLLPGPLILKFKAIFVVFDVVLAFFTYKISALRWPNSRVPIAAALIVVLLPTVVVNASFWGQIDAMWAAPALGAVYFLLRGNPWWGVGLCGFAVAIKPQGIFVFPLLALLVLAGRIPWRALLAAPAVYLALDLPALIAGRDPVELLSVYSLDRQSHWVNGLTFNAPSIWAIMPASTRMQDIKSVGNVLAIAAVVGVIYVLIVRRLELTPARIVTAAALFSILMPFLLPGMHERYFFLADVMTLVLAIYRPKLWYVPVLVQSGSMLAYEHYLFRRGPLTLPLSIAAMLILAALLVTGYALFREAFAPREDHHTPDEPAPTSGVPAPRQPDATETVPGLPALNPPGGRPASLPSRPA
jgi:Gpi18-like mannosyltransferase